MFYLICIRIPINPISRRGTDDNTSIHQFVGRDDIITFKGNSRWRHGFHLRDRGRHLRLPDYLPHGLPCLYEETPLATDRPAVHVYRNRVFQSERYLDK